jgi:LCP family protein required for cell wall assembly
VKKKGIIIGVSIFLILVISGIAGAYFYVKKSIYKPTEASKVFSTKEEQQKSDYVEENGIYNILLCGLDGRKSDTDSRTDSMIVATIDTNNKTLKLVSFMRDMYLPIPGHGQTRLNTAFFLGGPELLMKTLNDDFNYNIQYYATIDFHAFQSLVELVGGVDVEVKDYELKQLNYYIKEANWHNPDFLTHAGFQHLNGQQALSYCRIRKVGNNDYERTERQRKVLSLIIQKVKKMSIFKYPSLLAAVLPDIKTNMQPTKLANLGFTVMKFSSTTVQSARIPADNMFQGMKVGGADVLVPDMDKTVAYLDNFLSSTGSSGVSNLPTYMINNYHENDIAIDKRSVKHSAVKIQLPKNSKRSNTLEPGVKDDTNLTQDIPEVNDVPSSTKVPENGTQKTKETKTKNDTGLDNMTPPSSSVVDQNSTGVDNGSAVQGNNSNNGDNSNDKTNTSPGGVDSGN